MALIRDCTQHACAFVFGCTGVAMGVGGAGLTAVIGGTALAGTCVAAVYEGNKKHAVENKRELERLIRRTTEEWRKQPEFKKHDPGRDLSDASDALIEYLPKCDMSRDRLIAHAAEAPGRPFPDAATDHVLAELTRLAPEIYGEGGTPIARDFATAIIRSAFTAAIENRAYYEHLEPHLLFKIAEVQGLTVKILSEVLHGQNEIKTDLKTGFSSVHMHLDDVKALLQQELTTLSTTILSTIQPTQDTSIATSALAMGSTDEIVTTLMIRATELVDLGDLSNADLKLAEAESHDLDCAEPLLLRAVQNRAKRAELALATKNFQEAANHFARAAILVRPYNEHEWVRFKRNEGDSALKGVLNGSV